jgi:hypothetical protein
MEAQIQKKCSSKLNGNSNKGKKLVWRRILKEYRPLPQALVFFSTPLYLRYIFLAYVFVIEGVKNVGERDKSDIHKNQLTQSVAARTAHICQEPSVDGTTFIHF